MYAIKELISAILLISSFRERISTLVIPWDKVIRVSAPKDSTVVVINLAFPRRTRADATYSLPTLQRWFAEVAVIPSVPTAAKKTSFFFNMLLITIFCLFK